MIVPFYVMDLEYYYIFLGKGPNNNINSIILIIISLLFFLFGALVVGVPFKYTLCDVKKTIRYISSVKIVYNISYWMFLLGSILWLIVPFITDIGLLKRLISLDLLPLAKMIREASSFRTLTNFGPIAYSSSWFMSSYDASYQERSNKFRRGIIVFFTLARVALTAERTPLIYLLIIFVVILVRRRRVNWSSLLYRISLVISSVWITEIFRSYASEKYSSYNVADYLLNRFIFYYASSLHNLNWILEYDVRSPGFISMRPLIKLFGIESNGELVHNDLIRFGSEEFNNLSSFGEMYIDLGLFSFVYWFILGLTFTWSLKLFLKNDYRGYVLFPFMVYACFEAPRYSVMFTTKFYFIAFTLFLFGRLIMFKFDDKREVISRR